MPKVKRKTGAAAIPPDQIVPHPDQNVPHPPSQGEPPLMGTTDPSEKFIIDTPLNGMYEVKSAEDSTHVTLPEGASYVTLPEGVYPQDRLSWIDAGDGEHFHLLEYFGTPGKAPPPRRVYSSVVTIANHRFQAVGHLPPERPTCILHRPRLVRRHYVCLCPISLESIVGMITPIASGHLDTCLAPWHDHFPPLSPTSVWKEGQLVLQSMQDFPQSLKISLCKSAESHGCL